MLFEYHYEINKNVKRCKIFVISKKYSININTFELLTNKGMYRPPLHSFELRNPHIFLIEDYYKYYIEKYRDFKGNYSYESFLNHIEKKQK